jgi:hypothetical protein
MRTVINTDSAPGRRSIDALLELYVSWREACQAVRQAYGEWGESDHSQRTLTYAGYLAALDREEQAASAYADQIDLVNRICK